MYVHLLTDSNSLIAGGQRDWVQVHSNGTVACVAALLYCRVAGFRETPLSPDTLTLFSLACLSALSCCCGDTWASEVGSVLGGAPRLITTGARVPKGTNGGVTLVGLLCSFAGGVIVGLAYFIALVCFVNFSEYSVTISSQALVILIGGFAGLLGSIIDSVLGATVQFSGYSEKLGRVVNEESSGVKHISGINILDNHQVNFVSSLLTAVIVPLLWSLLCNHVIEDF